MRSLPPRALCLCLLAWALVGTDARAQMDPDNLPEPPTERLAALEPFFGLYAHTDAEWRGVGRFTGTMEIRPAIKGWYVEWVIDTRSGPIDRERRMLITWDRELGHYRVWGFETTPQSPPGTIEGSARMVADTFVMEWEDQPGPPGRPPASYRNRMFMAGPDELVTITDVLPEGASEPILLGEWHNERIREAGVADTLLSLTRKYEDAWETLDAEAILAFHPEDLLYYWRGRLTPSRDAFAQVLREQILPAAGEGYATETIDPRVQTLGPDAGVVSSRFRSEGSEEVEGAVSLVYERRNGTWKIVHVHESAATSE